MHPTTRGERSAENGTFQRRPPETEIGRELDAAAIGIADPQLKLVRLGPVLFLFVLTNLQQDDVSAGPHLRRMRYWSNVMPR